MARSNDSGTTEGHIVGIASVSPWDKRDDESDHAYGIFRRYLALGRSRSLRQAQEIAGHNTKSTVARWSMRHDWIDRARAFDEVADEREDAVLIDERANLMRDLVRERVSYQRSFHERVKGVPELLQDIAKDEDASSSARVAAMRLLIEQSGYSPATPIEREEGIGEIMVAELLRVASALAPEKRAKFEALLDEASVIRAAQRIEEGADATT